MIVNKSREASGSFLGNSRADSANTTGSERADSTVCDPSIGDILRRTKGLTPEQVEQVVAYQRDHNIKFGEAAVQLGLAKAEDVMWALAQQFHYPYAPSESQGMVGDELVAANQPFSEDVEAFRDIRAQLVLGVLAAEPRPALAVVSPNIGDGKSFISANLAVAFSQLPGRTLIVDADLRTPRLHELFATDGTRGLSSILMGRPEAAVVVPVPHLPNLYLLPAGTVPPNPTELIQRTAFAMLLREFQNKFDYVLVDTPAAAHGSDARIIATRCGASLVIGRRNRSRVPDLQKLVRLLAKEPMKMAGVLVNEF